jgi:NitT/TauT family transport system ATP-binding protein
VTVAAVEIGKQSARQAVRDALCFKSVTCTFASNEGPGKSYTAVRDVDMTVREASSSRSSAQPDAGNPRF